MLRSVLLCAALAAALAAPAPAFAQTQAMQPDIAALSQTLNIDSLIAVMRDEGLANSAQMEADLFPGQGGLPGRWWSTISTTPPACARNSIPP